MINDTDQQRCDQQDAIAEELYITGFSDGLDGDPPTSNDEAYQLGYKKGCAQLFEYNDKGEPYPGVDPGDCHWLYSEEF